MTEPVKSTQVPSVAEPLVSVILPTYNRGAFLSEAVAAIRDQTFTDWELIVVDDGSSEEVSPEIYRLLSELGRPARIVRQDNQGAYGARNTGLDLARGRYVAFFDSDDVWLSHHLADCVGALETHPEVDWVFAACRRIDLDSDRLLLPNTFYRPGGEPWPFLKLRARAGGRLRVLDDVGALACMLAGGLNCGLQASVIRRQVFDGYRFQTRFRNEAEDQMTVIWALASGRRMAYFDAVHVEYRVHSENSSATATQDLAKRIAVLEAEARGYEELPNRGVVLSRAEELARRRRLGDQYFWQIGYALLWQNGRRSEALPMFRRGLNHWPWNLRAWKTYGLAVSRVAMTSVRQRRRSIVAGVQQSVDPTARGG
jgi:glycosyltransferase involved in cell wall biosynthesis